MGAPLLRLPPCRAARWAALGLAVLAGSIGARAAIDPALDRRFGGVYSSACRDGAAPRLKLRGDTMQVERAGRTLLDAHTLRPAAAPPPGTPRGRDYQAAFVGEVAGGERLRVALFRNAEGLFVVADGGPRTAAALGPALRGQRLRHCDPERNRRPGAPPPPADRIPADYLRDARFKAAYAALLGPLARERWIARLDGPAPPVRQVRVGGTPHQLLAVCKPHDCDEHALVLLYAPESGRLAGKVVQAGCSTRLGHPSPAVAAALERHWAGEWRPR